MDHDRVLEIVSSGGSLEDFLREIEVPLEDHKMYDQVMKDLEDLFKMKYKDCQTQAFGSVHTGLCIKGSDIDISIEIDGTEEQLADLRNGPLEARFVHVGLSLMRQDEKKFLIIHYVAHARAPIIKFIHVPTKVCCDVSLENTLGIANSELIKHYMALDRRVYPYFMIIKYWACKYGLLGRGKITSYALVTLSAFYLQQLEPPVLPTVHQLQELSERKDYCNGWLCSFNKDPNAVEPSRNTSSLFELLAGFFNYYYKFNFGNLVICPYLGKTVLKIYFLKTEKLPEPLKTMYLKKVTFRKGLNVMPDLCVQDPIELSHNMTASTARDTLINFHHFIKAAVQVNQELLRADGMKNLMILNKLFTAPLPKYCKKAFMLTGTETIVTIVAVGLLSLFLIPDVKNTLNIKTNGGESTKIWFVMIYNLVITIFTKIMNCKVQSVKNRNKKQVGKVESPSNLPEPSNTEMHQKNIVDVECYYDYTAGRKKMRKEMHDMIPGSHCLDVEEAVSNELYKRHCADHPLDDPIVKFTCEFVCVDVPPGVELIFKDKGSQKGFYYHFTTDLKSRIPSLVQQYGRYMLEKARMQQKF